MERSLSEIKGMLEETSEEMDRRLTNIESFVDDIEDFREEIEEAEKKSKVLIICEDIDTSLMKIRDELHWLTELIEK